MPVLVLGAEHDGCFTAAELRRTAAAYRSEAEIMTGMGHDLMLDQGWPHRRHGTVRPDPLQVSDERCPQGPVVSLGSSPRAS